MANVTSIRTDHPAPGEAANASPLAPFRAGRPEEERVVDLLAFAMATERALLATPEAVQQLRSNAAADLAAWALRHLHNRVTEIRQEAVQEQLGHLPRPPGFVKLFSASLLAAAIAGGAVAWLVLHPATAAGLAGLISG